MVAQEVIDMASAQVNYHEKLSGTPVPDLYVKQNAYDGYANWTMFHNDLAAHGVSQGTPWCGYFVYWCFYQVLGQDFSATEDFLYNISNYGACGGAVSEWATVFGNEGLWHTSGYTPKPGDLVIFEDTGIPWSHVELVAGVDSWPTYINTIGGNTKQPWESGLENESQWVAARTRYAPYTAGWHVKGYCEVLYDGTPSPGFLDEETLIMSAFLKKKKRMETWY